MPYARRLTGDAKLTRGHGLPARYVIHAVGPVWYGGARGEPELLASCYRRAIELAEEVAATSIAFPAISCGVYRYPAEDAVDIAVGTVIDMPQAPNLARVVFACFAPDIYDLYRAHLAHLARPRAAVQRRLRSRPGAKPRTRPRPPYSTGSGCGCRAASAGALRCSPGKRSRSSAGSPRVSSRTRTSRPARTRGRGSAPSRGS
jgi:hypothetical protein